MAKIGLINMTNSITGWTNAAGNEMMSLRRMMEAMGHEVEITLTFAELILITALRESGSFFNNSIIFSS